MARRGTPAIRSPTWRRLLASRSSSSSTPEERPARMPAVLAAVRPWRISRTVVISEEAIELVTVGVRGRAGKPGRSARDGSSAISTYPIGSADQQAPDQRDRAWLEQPGAEPGRCVGQHRAPLGVVPSARRERTARRRRQTRRKRPPAAGAAQPSRFTVKVAGRRRPASRSARAESSSSSPSTPPAPPSATRNEEMVQPARAVASAAAQTLTGATASGHGTGGAGCAPPPAAANGWSQWMVTGQVLRHVIPDRRPGRYRDVDPGR